jgi:hypothetical protein
MPFAARVRSAVSSTTTGGLPGPAAMARLPRVHGAATTTRGRPVTTSSRMPGCFISACADSMVGSAIDGDQVGGRPRRRWPRSASLTRKLETPLADGCTLNTTALPPATIADAVADDGLGRVGRRRDRADDAEGRALDQHQAVIARPRDWAAGSRGLGVLFAHSSVLLELVVDVARGRSPRPPSRRDARRLGQRRVHCRIASMTRSQLERAGALQLLLCACTAAAVDESIHVVEHVRVNRRARGGLCVAR